jgi:hypothetical protein
MANWLKSNSAYPLYFQGVSSLWMKLEKPIPSQRAGDTSSNNKNQIHDAPERANWQFARFSPKTAWKESWQTANLPYLSGAERLAPSAVKRSGMQTGARNTISRDRIALPSKFCRGGTQSEPRRGVDCGPFCERGANEVFYGLACGPPQVVPHFLQFNQQAQG